MNIGAASTPKVDHSGVDWPRQGRTQETHGLRDITGHNQPTRERGLGGAILDNLLQCHALHLGGAFVRLQLPFCHRGARCHGNAADAVLAEVVGDRQRQVVDRPVTSPGTDQPATKRPAPPLNKMIRPPPAARMCGSTARTSRKEPTTFSV